MVSLNSSSPPRALAPIAEPPMAPCSLLGEALYPEGWGIGQSGTTFGAIPWGPAGDNRSRPIVSARQCYFRKF